MQKRAAFASVLLCACAAWADVSGRVYRDANQNGRPDAGEPGVAGVAVSDGNRVVATDGAGRYRLATASTSALIWICVPRDCAASGAFWRLVETGETADFGLAERKQSDDFLFVQITDTHVGRDDLVARFARHVMAFPVRPSFVINTGDLVGGVDTVPPEKAQVQYDRYLRAAAAFTLPLFNLPGNHEHVAFNTLRPDTTHPFYGKGLYRKVFGPTYYSWDWAGVHAVALDGTSLPYQERLGTNQLAWLAADLALLPAEKPLLLFCHQPVYTLRDAAALSEILRGRRVLGAFCGHLHATFETSFSGFPVFVSGAMSGAWWSGPNIDGTPQGFRLAQVRGGVLKTVYVGREGDTPLSAVSPLATAVLTNDVAAVFAVVDFGRPAGLAASFDGRPVTFSLASREELWSFWKGYVPLGGSFDGDRVLRVVARQGEAESTNEIRYLVDVGRPQPYRAEAGATLRMQVRGGVAVAGAVLFNGQLLGAIPVGVTNETTLAFSVVPDQLRKFNRVELRAGQGPRRPPFSAGPVWLEYKGKKIHDLRYASFERHSVGGDPRRPPKVLYYCLP